MKRELTENFNLIKNDHSNFIHRMTREKIFFHVQYSWRNPSCEQLAKNCPLFRKQEVIFFLFKSRFSHSAQGRDSQDLKSFVHDGGGRLAQKQPIHVDFDDFPARPIFLHAITNVIKLGKRS